MLDINGFSPFYPMTYITCYGTFGSISHCYAYRLARSTAANTICSTASEAQKIIEQRAKTDPLKTPGIFTRAIATQITNPITKGIFISCLSPWHNKVLHLTRLRGQLSFGVRHTKGKTYGSYFHFTHR